jgi:Putative prokaryotic signal transducing protein
MPQPATPLPNPNERLVRIFDTEQEAEAMVVRGLLESAGIDSQFGENENSPDVLPVGGMSLLVREEDAAEAREIIAEFRRSPEQEAAEESDFEQSAMDAANEEDSPER